MKNNKLVAIDLFCGCGGFSYGFQQAGFDMALGIDMWKDATVTYKHNFPNACVINEDITSISSDDILSILNMSADDIDVIDDHISLTREMIEKFRSEHVSHN